MGITTGLARSTRLMLAGRLQEATAEIQRSLGSASPMSSGPMSSGPMAGRFTPGSFGTGTFGAGFPGSSGFGSGLGGSGLGGSGLGGTTSAGAGSTAPGTVTRGSANGLAYRLYVPTRPQSPAPLLVALHGGTQDAATFATSTGLDEVAEREGVVVVYPEQSRSANAMGYWNWFRPGDQARDAGEPGQIAAVVREVSAAHEVDRDRVGVVGFSAGAAMAAVLAAVYPDVFCGAGVHSGLPYRAATDVGSAFAAMKTPPGTVADGGPVPLCVIHGDADPTVAPANADAVVRSGLVARQGAREERTTGQVEGGRSWTRRRWSEEGGRVVVESWTVHGMTHDWSGGRAGASYADPSGPDASSLLVEFLGMRRS